MTNNKTSTRDDENTTARCPTGYYLTSCTLLSESNSYRVDGVRVPEDLSHSCVAQNGDRGKGVRVSY